MATGFASSDVQVVPLASPLPDPQNQHPPGEEDRIEPGKGQFPSLEPQVPFEVFEVGLERENNLLRRYDWSQRQFDQLRPIVYMFQFHPFAP